MNKEKLMPEGFTEDHNGNRIKEAINHILEAIKQENIEPIARAVFRGKGKPSDKWSFANRLIMYISGTLDARGYRQWQQVERHVKKGARALYIFGPILKKKTVEKESETEDGEIVTENKEIEALVGFKTIPVFKYEDTEGKPLEAETFKVELPCTFDGLLRELEVNVTTCPFDGVTLGLYSPAAKQIVLSTPEIDVFLHELSHAADIRLNSFNGEKQDGEIVAELSGATMGYLMGYKVPIGDVKRYIETNGGKVFHLLERTERVINYIISRTAGHQIHGD